MLHAKLYKILLDIWYNIDGQIFRYISILLNIVHTTTQYSSQYCSHYCTQYMSILPIIVHNIAIMLLKIIQYFSILYTILYTILSTEFPDIVQNFVNNCLILFTVFDLILWIISSNISSKIVHKIANNISILNTILFKCPPCPISRLMPASPPGILSLLRQGALQNSHRAALRLPGSIVFHASSGQFLGSLLSDHSAQLLRVRYVEVTDAASESFHWIFDHRVGTLVLGGHFPKTWRGTMLC